MEYSLRQQGRAKMEFLADLFKSAAPIGQQVKADMQAAGLNADSLPDDLDARIATVNQAMADSRAQRLQHLIGEWSSDVSGRTAHAAFHEIKPEIEDELKRLAHDGACKLVLKPDFKEPDYYHGVWFHRTTGGWSDDPYQGFVHGELIHRQFVNPGYGGKIFQQRRDVMKELPRQDFKRIFEMGCGSGHSTLALQDVFPEADVSGCDIAAPMLEQAARVGNEHGHAWTLYQCAAEDTGLPDESFDLITSYIILHENPASAIRGFVKEAFRLLEPGGYMLMADVPPYAALDKMTAYHYDSLSMRTGEPWWREAASLDMAEVAREAGFVDAKSYGLSEPPYPYPWVTVAKKPE